MSTKLYRLYQVGNPRTRVFLPDFWMKLVHIDRKQPPNVVMFHVHMNMTRLDIKNYLERIYNVPVGTVRIQIKEGEYERHPTKRYAIGKTDTKIAYVHLAEGNTFEFPDVFPEDKKSRDDMQAEEYTKMKELLRIQEKKKWESNRVDIPSWFSSV